MQLPETIFLDFFRVNPIPQVLILAETGAVLQANKAACDYYGLDPWPESLPHLYDFDTHLPAVTMAELNLAAQGFEHTIRSTHRTAMGMREVEIYTSVAGAVPNTVLLATIHDVTEQLYHERSVSSDEERWRSALCGSGEGVWDWDITSDEVNCSLRWKEMLGHSRDELGDDIREWLSLVSPDDREQVTTAYEKMLAGGCNKMEMEYRMCRKDGGMLWILDRCTVLRWDVNGRPARIISVHSDITQRKIIEARLRSFNESLEQEVRERTAELNRELSVRRETEHRLRAFQDRLAALTEELCLTEERERRRLAAWLHDDIGQNLALLKIRLDRLDRQIPGGRERFQEISGLLAMTIAEIRSCTMQLSPPLLQSLGLAPAIVKLADELGAMHGFSVQVNGQQVLPELPLSIASIMYRIVKELLINVVKHAGADHVVLDMACTGEEIALYVRDNGRGFDPEQLETAAMHNNSFGLFHVRQRMGLLGGVLKVDSSPGQGSVCSIHVPLPSGDAWPQEFPY